MIDIKYLSAGECSLIMEFGNQITEQINDKVKFVYDALTALKIDGVTEALPTFRSIMINYKPDVIDFSQLKDKLSDINIPQSFDQNTQKNIIEIPVLYGGEEGLDMQNVCQHTGLSQDEVIKIHSDTPYRIYMLGFLPGFAYLGGMDKRLITPRLANPRTKIPQGSVGIGGEQTGIYPLESPGGWQLIGRTPLKPYDLARENPFLYRAGDYIKFKPITKQEYSLIKGEICRSK